MHHRRLPPIVPVAFLFACVIACSGSDDAGLGNPSGAGGTEDGGASGSGGTGGVGGSTGGTAGAAATGGTTGGTGGDAGTGGTTGGTGGDAGTGGTTGGTGGDAGTGGATGGTGGATGGTGGATGGTGGAAGMGGGGTGGSAGTGGATGGTGGSAGTGPCPHDVCTTGAPLFSTCSPCVEKVCAQDAYCCMTAWNSYCVSGAKTLCGECGGTGGSGGACSHDECTTGPALSPSCTPCVQTICNTDPFCCNNYWNVYCINHAKSLCGLCGG
jgi:hypothetical protein